MAKTFKLSRTAYEIEASYVRGSNGWLRLGFRPAGTVVTDDLGKYTVRAGQYYVGWEAYPTRKSGSFRLVKCKA